MEQKYPAYIVDAFTTRRFAGNPAAVCLIPKALPENEYNRIAAEFNLSETAFPTPEDGTFETATSFLLRWFTPKTEVPLCGHATLATAHVLLYIVNNKNKEVKFQTKSGELRVKKFGVNKLEMNFPQYRVMNVVFPNTPKKFEGKFDELTAPVFFNDIVSSTVPTEIRVEHVAFAPEAKKMIIVIDPKTTKFELENLSVDVKGLLASHEGSTVRGVIVTLAPSDAKRQGFVDEVDQEYDYACRYFAPWVGISEDPATGSAQCALAPFWAKILNKSSLYGLQSFPGRGAQFNVSLENDRAILRGNAVTVLKGEIELNEPTFF